MKPHVKLHIPGPIEVSDDTYAAMAQPMMGHRGSGFQDLYADLQPKLRQILYTKNPVFLSTSSAWGVMEASVRNLVSKKVLNCCCGAFSDKWLDVSKRCGLNAEALKVEWGQPILPELIDAKLKTGQFDAITLVHNETSTGVMNPLAEIAAVMKKYPDVIFIVDTVSSMTGVKIECDALGIDVMLASVQKAWALPPGFAVFAVSEKALKKAETVPNRGYYFDFLEFKTNHDKNMTPSTPSLPHIYGLQHQANKILAEGLDARYARHLKMAGMVRDWAKRNGFELFPKAGYESITLTCVKNNRNIDVAKFQKAVKDKHKILIDGGYGQIKGKSFRVSHMGDETPESMKEVLTCLDDGLKQTPVLGDRDQGAAIRAGVATYFRSSDQPVRDQRAALIMPIVRGAPNAPSPDSLAQKVQERFVDRIVGQAKVRILMGDTYTLEVSVTCSSQSDAQAINADIQQFIGGSGWLLK